MSEFDDLLIFKDMAESKTNKSNDENKEKINKPLMNKTEEKKIENDESDLNKSRNNAKGLHCFIHPWRDAYAICSYCQKPFCFEDIIKYKNEYYCISDIDRVSKETTETNLIEYSNLSYISIIAFLTNFLIFIYYSNQEIRLIISKLIINGVYYASHFINFSYLLFFVTAILVLFQFISGLLILIKLKKSYLIGLMSGIFSILFFLYVYLNSNNIFSLYAIISSFVGAIVLMYSFKVYTRIEINEKPAEDKMQINFADVKTF